MLYLYQSDRLAFLAEAAVALMQHEPLGDAWTVEEVVVQSQGMRRYLSRYLAERVGIAANVRFVLPAALNWSLTRRVLPDEPALNPFSPDVMRWRLLQAFVSGDLPEQARAGLATYLGSHETAAYDLSGKIADVFDQYLVYRPDWLAAWAVGRTLNLGEDETWQADLWRFLLQTGQGRHRAAQQAALLAGLGQAKLPARYVVFGVSSMAPMYVNLLNQLALHTDVHLFAVNPCSVYWGDVGEGCGVGHPLLAALGRQGRDFFEVLHDGAPLAAQHDWFAADAGETVLRRLQSDIRCFRPPEAGSGSMADGSIVIQAAHSPLRELQILKDWLLQALADDPDLQPHQIAVLVPDVARYAPFIGAVFGTAQAGSPRLPYSIADVRLPSGTDWQQLLRLLLALVPSRFEVEAVLPLLDCASVRQFWGWSEEDVRFLKRECGRLSVRWGTDAAMRARYGGNDAAFTWQQAAQRTALGWLMPDALGGQTAVSLVLHGQSAASGGLVPALGEPFSASVTTWASGGLDSSTQYEGLGKEDCAASGGLDALDLEKLAAQTSVSNNPNPLSLWEKTRTSGGLWQGMAPHRADWTRMEVQARFFCLLDALQAQTARWQQDAPVAVWCERMGDLLAAVVGEEADGVLLQERQETAAFLAQWQETCRVAGMTADLDMASALRHLQGLAVGDDEAGFLRGGITFCGMVPMRSLPFEVLCLLGLNDGRFPRQRPVPAFDLVARHPKRGDRVRRDDDRYLFLEAIMSAQKRLYLSYEGRNSSKNDALTPSPVLAQLCDVLAQMCGYQRTAEFVRDHVRQHPLQAFSSSYFLSPPQSSRQDYAAAWQAEACDANTPFTASGGLEALDSETVAWADFVRFWRHPVRHWLRQRLQWRGFHLPEPFESAEPYDLSAASGGLASLRQQVREAYLQARQTGQSLEATTALLRAQGHVPAGLLGDCLLQNEADAVRRLPQKYFTAKRLPPHAFVFDDGQSTLTGSLDTLTPLGQLLFLPEAGRAPDEVEWHLRHLAYAAQGGGASHVVCPDGVQILPAMAQETAQILLHRALHYYRLGQNEPLPFFPKTSLLAAKEWLENGGDGTQVSDKALAAARQAYYGSEDHGGGQIARMEEEQVFGRDAQGAVETALFWDVLAEVWLPLLRCVRVDEKGD